MRPPILGGLPGMALDNGHSANDKPEPFTLHDDAYFAAATARSKIQGLRDIGILMNSRRTASLNAIRGIASACIDEDDSGTYDPKESRSKTTIFQPRRMKKAKRADGDEDPSQELGTRRGTQAEYSLPITAPFSSPQGLDYSRSISPDPFDDGASNPDGMRTESPHFDNGILITRRQYKKPTRLSDEDRTDGLTLDQLGDGQPQRRGCKACLAAGDDECSLIEYTYNYPCNSCHDASIDCELITLPEFKRVCERCKKKRIACSYKIDGGKGVLACDGCRDAGVICCAGPLRATHAKKFQREEVSRGTPTSQGAVAVQPAASSPTAATQIGVAPQTTVTPAAPVPSAASAAPARLYVACNQCRDDGLRCSLKRYQTGPCKNCKEIDENCKFILIPQSAKLVSNTTTSVKAGSAGKKPKSKKRNSKNKKKKRKQRPKKTRKAKKKGTIRGSRHAPLPPPGPKPRETQGIVHIVIRTSFAHPITFNHIPAPDGASPCSWCSSPFFGLFGHGEREVEVIPWPGGHGYEEIGLPLAEKIDPISNINSSRNINNRGSSNSNNIIHAKDNAEEKKDLRGHNQLGEERSRMCVPCTFQRVHIMACDTHQMLPMDDIDPRIFDSKEWDRAVVALERGDEEGSKIVTGSKWCSVCPALAEYRCVAKQESIFGDDDDFETKRGGKAGERQCEKGCGLLLCETCKDILGKLEAAMKFSTAQGPRDGNVLDRLVRVVQGDRFHYPIGARADAGFLTLEGELNCRLEKGFGEDMSVKMECEGEKGGEEDDEGDDELDELMMDGERSASENGGWDGDEDVFFKAEERSEDSDKGKRGGELEVIVISDDED